MELYIGGYKQGKTEYVRRTRPHARERMVPEFHKWFRQMLLDGTDAEAQTAAYLEAHPDCIIISDEVGNGIVPMDPFEREYRERLGRMLIVIAERAERVERVICGLGQRIK